jgi:hypothetical protein
MATKTFGITPLTADDVIAQLYQAIGENFPISVTVMDGRVTNFSFETEWKEGTTKQVETDELDENDNPIIEYEEHYVEKALTDQQIATLEQWAAKHVAS